MLVFIAVFMAVCLASSSGLPAGTPSKNPVKTDIAAIYIGGGAGACELPKGKYTTPYAIAIGDDENLEELQWMPEYCGHIFTVDCGKGALEAVLINSNMGGGLNLYPSTWKQATGGIPPNEVRCNISITDKNMYSDTDKPQCFHSTSEMNNAYFRKIALFNTQGNLVVGASLNGAEGTRDGPFFVLNVKATKKDMVTFRYLKGGEFSLPLSECRDGSDDVFFV